MLYCSSPWPHAAHRMPTFPPLLCPLYPSASPFNDQQLLGIDVAAARAISIRQPSLLTRQASGVEAKVAEYKALFGDDAARDMLAGAPQLLTMACESVRVRHELLQALARAQPGWSSQLEEAGPALLGVWLTSRCGLGMLGRCACPQWF